MKRPVIGLALGCGAAKGYAHIGVLQVLEREKIPIDIIVGSSIGALIGALYAAGINTIMLERLAHQIRRRNWMDISVSTKGLIAGDKIEAILKLLTKNLNFDQLSIPLGVVATDLCTKQAVLIKDGNVASAVRASIAIPGIFYPKEINGRVLVDGGVLERVPGKMAREMGADFVIAVELGFSDYLPPKNIYEVLIQTFDVMGREIQNLKQYDCDVLISPHLSDVDGLAFNKVGKCIDEGRKAAEKAVPWILKNIGRKVDIFEK